MSDSKSKVLIEVKDLSFSYPETDEPTLKDINLSIYAGELAILTGPSGCGKSTLCRHLNGVIPHLSTGTITSGTVLVNGMDTRVTPVHILSSHVGMVQQDPESQMVCIKVEDELAFGPENIGLNHEEILERLEMVVDWVQLQDVYDNLTFECSGGQKQKVAIGSSLSLLPDVLVMDEPTTDLDPVAAQDIVSTIRRLRDEAGVTFLVVEHDLDELLEVADRLIVMKRGCIIFNGNPQELFNLHYSELESIGLRIPQHIVMTRCLAGSANQNKTFSIKRKDATKDFNKWAQTIQSQRIIPPRTNQWNGMQGEQHHWAIKADNVSFSYRGDKNAVEDINLEIMPGEFVGLVGANGSGKSTLARLLIGLLHPDIGEISILGMDPTQASMEEVTSKVGYLFQNPDSQLFNHTVEREITFGMKVRNMSDDIIEAQMDKVLSMLAIIDFKERHPFSLSRGERQRLAMATVLVTDPDVIILDEPTTGQDRKNLENLIMLMNEWIERKNATIIMIAHDMDLVCEYAEKTLVMSDGHIVCNGPTEEVFYEHFSTLRDLRLIPPVTVESSYPHVGEKLSRVLLSLDEFNDIYDKDMADQLKGTMPSITDD